MPRTEALDQQIERFVYDLGGWPDEGVDEHRVERLRAIAAASAAEAVTAALDALAVEVAGLEHSPCVAFDYAEVMDRAAVLAAIKKAKKKAAPAAEGQITSTGAAPEA